MSKRVLFIATAASKSVLAKAEAIKKSSLAYLDKATESVESSDEEEEERKKEKELLEKTLRKYYLSLASNTGSNTEESQGKEQIDVWSCR